MRIKDTRQTFLGWWVRLLLEGRAIEIYGDGAQLRDFNYVDDAVDAFLAAACTEAAYGQIMNLGSREVVSLGELARRMVAAYGGGDFRLVPFPSERKAIDIGDYYSDYTRAETLLGWAPRIGLEEGLTRTLAYFKEFGAQYL